MVRLRNRLGPVPAAVVLAAALLSGCATTGRSVDGGVAQVQDGFGEALTAPLEDVNLRRDAIPAVLLEAAANAYDVRGLDSCAAVGREVMRLDEALGPDLDTIEPDGRLLSEHAADAAAEVTLDAVRGAATDLVPFRSWVRLLSGAEQHSRRVQAAIIAGRTRRGFLKGVGLQMNCAPPAAPRWFRPSGPGSPGARQP